MTAKRVDWKPGEPLPPPGTIVGDIDLHAPGVRFGVVLAPASSERVDRITSADPAVWKPAVAEAAKAVYAWDERKAAADLERAQLARWGTSGISVLGVVEEADDVEHRGQYADDRDAAETDELLALIDQL
jgi:hypothetical protein